jgi:hypothetical protein
MLLLLSRALISHQFLSQYQRLLSAVITHEQSLWLRYSVLTDCNVLDVITRCHRCRCYTNQDMFRRPDDTPEHYRYYAAPAAVFISGYGIAKVSCVSAITLLQRSTFMSHFKVQHNITSTTKHSGA